MSDLGHLNIPKRKFATDKSARITVLVAHKFLIYTGLFLSICALIFIASVSVDLSLLGFTIIGLCILYLSEIRREDNIKSELSESINRVVIAQEDLLQGVLGNSQDIAKIKEELKTLNQKNINKPFASQTAKEEQSGLNVKLIDPRSPARQVNHPILNSYLSQQRNNTRPQTPEKQSQGRERLYRQSTKTPKHTSPLKPARKTDDESIFSPDTMSDIIVRELIHNAIKNKKIDLFLQPIFRMPSNTIIAYELYARIRAKKDVYIPASRYMQLAQDDEVMAEIDNMLLLQGIEALKESELSESNLSFFINLKPDTLKNRIFMNTLLAFLSDHKNLASNLIFELAQEDFNNVNLSERKIMAALAKIGCQFSLDHCRLIPEDVRALQVMRVRFIKIKSEILLNATGTDKDFTTILRKKRKLESNGIGLIVDHIESEHILARLEEYNIGYAQGYLFGPPDLYSYSY